jgi:hypothetical protein
MDISNIIAIAGTGGLFKVVKQLKSGYLAESLTDKKRIPIHATQKIVQIDGVGIYTTGDEMPIKEVFQKIYDKEGGKECTIINAKDDELKEYFKTVLPEYDQERVYPSIIKKILFWYNILQKEGLLEKAEDPNEEEKISIINANEGTKGKAGFNDLDSKHVKTEGSKVKAAGVRKTGVA